jgi:hypothetical protein
MNSPREKTTVGRATRSDARAAPPLGGLGWRRRGLRQRKSGADNSAVFRTRTHSLNFLLPPQTPTTADFSRARRTAMVPLNGTASAYRMARFFMRRSPDARPGRPRRRRECGLGGGAPRFSNEIGRNSDPRMRGRYSSGASCQRAGIGRRRPSTGHRSSRVRPRLRHSQRAGCKRPCCDPPQGWHLVLPAEASLQVRLPRPGSSDFSLLLSSSLV